MPYQVKLSETVARALRKYHPDIKKLVKAAITQIAEKPFLAKELQEELYGFMSYRFKRYRILYRIDQQKKIVYVYQIGHRKNIYELFEKIVNKKNG